MASAAPEVEVEQMPKKEKNRKEPDIYVIGSGEAPEWCKDKLMPYQQMNGRVGFLFSDGKKDIALKPGDVLARKGEQIVFRRKVQR